MEEAADRETDAVRLMESLSVTVSVTDLYRSLRAVGTTSVLSGVPGLAGAVSSSYQTIRHIICMWEQIGTKFAQNTTLSQPTRVQ